MIEDRPVAGTSTNAGAMDALTRPDAAFEIRSEDVRGSAMPVFRDRMHSLREVLESSRRFGTRTYLVDDDVRLSYTDHLAAVDSLAYALQERFRVSAGDRIAIFAANRWEWLVTFWAATTIGAIPALMNGWWTAEEFTDAARQVEPVLVVGDRVRLERVAESGVQLACLGLDDVSRLLHEYEGAAPRVCETHEDDPAMLIFTSGTTGRPKAAVLPNRAAVGFAQVNTLLEVAAKVDYGIMPIPHNGRDLPPSDDIALVTVPLFHVSGLLGYAVLTLARGSAIVLLPGRFDPERVLRTIEKEQVTAWSPLGSTATRFATCPQLSDYDTRSLISIRMGGAPVGPVIQQQLRSAVPSAAGTLSVSYTSTEAGAVVATINGADCVEHPTSVGRVNPSVQVEIRDESGVPMPDGQCGEVHVRSAYTMLGYWQDADASTAVLKEDGWLAMGDLGHVDAGLLYLESRARDVIIVNAENVSPTEVEFVLEEHPDIGEVAVLGVDDAVTGDAVCAVVVPNAGASPAGEELAQWCRRRLAYFKVPTRWHIVAGPLPRTATGKLLRREVRARIQADAGNASRPIPDVTLTDRESKSSGGSSV